MAPSSKTSSPRHLAIPNAKITSRDNQWLKRFRAALSGERGSNGYLGVEGARLVEAALGSGFVTEALLVSDSGEKHLARLSLSLPEGAQILRTSDRLFAGIADTKSPQGIAVLVRFTQMTIESLLRGTALVVVLVGVQDPGNVGTILRAAEAFGATAAATCPALTVGTADPFGPKALRASAGSAFRLPILQTWAASDLLSKFRDSGIKTYAAVAATDQSKDTAEKLGPSVQLPWEIDWKSPVALLIGNEGAGLPEDVVRAANGRVSIPQVTATTPVGVESLNAAMAATVLLYEAMRQRDVRDKH